MTNLDFDSVLFGIAVGLAVGFLVSVWIVGKYDKKG